MHLTIKHYFMNLLLFSVILYSNGEKHLVCDTGIFKSLKYPVKYEVTQTELSNEGCKSDVESADDIASWPGTPEELSVSYTSLQNKTFSLSWKPPDDASAHKLTGFLVEMFIEDYSDFSNFLPSACVFVRLHKIPLEKKRMTRRGILQDTRFHVDCKVNQKGPLSVFVTVKSLPVPMFWSRTQREHKEASVYADFMVSPVHYDVTVSKEWPLTTLLLNSEDNQVSFDKMFGINEGTVPLIVVLFFGSLLTLVIPLAILIGLKLRKPRALSYGGNNEIKNLKRTCMHNIPSDTRTRSLFRKDRNKEEVENILEI